MIKVFNDEGELIASTMDEAIELLSNDGYTVEE